MSWSISVIGKPENVCAELDRQSETLTGQSKVEFDFAKPHLQALVRENFAAKGTTYVEPLVHLEASGSGMGREDGEQIQRKCQVSIKPQWTKLV